MNFKGLVEGAANGFTVGVVGEGTVRADSGRKLPGVEVGVEVEGSSKAWNISRRNPRKAEGTEMLCLRKRLRALNGFLGVLF
jgi:hypothetical protein